ncbi:uncharacterized protein C05D11.1-like [Bradysia coprophila]|uniref:uncharacterized protein C05D11.1-like n=1 Tax=Bradysia coprophila TaxID=38358 RepID=UPI00187D8292|nr:uncharacterized protein C05D11.1-like [Bradysia coprophila]
MDYIRDQIEDSIASYANSLETNPYDTISAAIADDFLYGTTRNDFRNRMNAIDQLKYLAKAPKSYWINLIDDYFVDTAYAQSIGIPSKAELDRLTKENEELVPKRKAKLGPEGLKKKAEELADAIAINSRPVPDSVITSVPVPSIGDIDFFDVEIYRTNDDNANQPEGLDLDSWPIYAEAYDCRTNYIYITITIFTGDVKPTLRPYLYLLLKLMAESKINHDAEMDALNDFETISFDYRMGLTEPLKSFSCGSFSQTASVLMQVEQWQYDIGIKYLLARLQYTTFNATMIKDAASSLLNDYIPSALNHEYASIDLLNSMYYKADSNSRMYSTLIQKKFLTSLIASMDDETAAKQILDDIRILREQVISTANLAVHITADFTKLIKSKVDLNAPWKLFNFGPGSKTLNVVSNTEVMVDVASISGQGEIVGVDQETSYVSQHSPGVVYSDPDLPALTVACAYCTQIMASRTKSWLFLLLQIVPYSIRRCSRISIIQSFGCRSCIQRIDESYQRTNSTGRCVEPKFN